MARHPERSVVVEKGTRFTLLPIPYPARAWAITNSGDVAGTLWFGPYSNQGAPHAFVLDGKDLVILPPLPGATSSTAAAMNNRGDVVGASGTHAVIWERK